MTVMVYCVIFLHRFLREGQLLETGKFWNLACEPNMTEEPNIIKIPEFRESNAVTKLSLTAAIEHRPTKEVEAIMGPRLISM